MTRYLPVAVVCLGVLLAAETAHAQGPPAGRWKFRITEGDQPITFLFSFSQTDGKWIGDFIGSSARLQREPTFGTVTVSGDAIKFILNFNGREFISFDGIVAKDGSKIMGSASQFGGPLRLTEMRPSQLKKLDDPLELARETVRQVEEGPELFDAGFTVLGLATEKKLPVEEVRGVADRMTKAAVIYGPRWERTIAVRIATTLAEQSGFADVAIAQARRAERMLAGDDPIGVQMEVYDSLARVLTKTGKADEAKKYAGLLQKLEAKDYEEYSRSSLGFTPTAFEGRKAKSDRAVLVELFTGAECPPCVAADLAADGLMRSFGPSEVIVVQYHFHVPGPDPLTSPDGMERVATYADVIRGAPTVIVNGKPLAGGGGPASAAKDRYAAYREVIDKQLETPAPVKLAVAVTPGEKGAVVKATVSDLEATGEKLMLRFTLVEERVRYTGGNGVRYHHQVVRAMPGGAKGFPIKNKTHEQTVTLEPVNALRERLEKYLDDYARNEEPFPRSERPLALNDLKLVAFVQNDASGEVLQAVQVDVK